MTHAEFYASNPMEVAARARAARKRRNRDVTLVAWAVAQIVAPHVKDVSVRDYVLSAPGYDPDPEDLV